MPPSNQTALEQTMREKLARAVHAARDATAVRDAAAVLVPRAVAVLARFGYWPDMEGQGESMAGQEAR